jgi:hypothetical protein
VINPSRTSIISFDIVCITSRKRFKMAKNKKIEKLLTELERMPMLRDYFNTIKDEIEKKY